MQAAAPHPQEAARLSALKRLDILDSEAEQAFDELTEIASAICDTPISLISLVDADRQWFKSRQGIDASETPRSQAFCAHAILQDGIFEVPNALEDERFADNPLVAAEPGIRFYAGAPLVTGEGMPIGTLCVIDNKPRLLSGLQRRALRTLAHQVVGQLELRQHNRRLQAVVDNRDKLFSVIAHDLRGPFNSILGFSRTLSEKASSLKPERIVDMAHAILSGSLRVYQRLDELLQWAQNHLGGYRAQLVKQPLLPLLKADLDLLQDALSLKRLRIDYQLNDSLQVVADATLTKTVMRNLLTNASKYSEPGKVIVVRAKALGEVVQVSVENIGPAMPDDIKDQLFLGPVDSQISSGAEQGHGIGLSLCYDLMLMQHGRIELDESFSQGTRIVFTLQRAD